MQKCVETTSSHPATDVGFRFGRIGLMLRYWLKTGVDRIGAAVVLRALKDKELDLNRRASLLRRDSVHGSFRNHPCRYREPGAYLQWQCHQIYHASDPGEVDYKAYGINNALVVDSTGAWRDEEGLSRHLQANGAAKVLLTTSAKGSLKNIVSGVNSDQVMPEDKLIGAASCTTNAIVPVLKCMNDRFGIVRGHMETVHAYTDDQNLHDNIHPGSVVAEALLSTSCSPSQTPPAPSVNCCQSSLES